MFPLIPITPDPTAVDLGIIKIGWYGIGYVVGLAVLLAVTQTEVARRGIDPAHVWGALLMVGALALAGGRLYHVIDEWEFYSRDLSAIVLPPYSGLGLYGGVAGAALGIILYVRWKRLPVRLSFDSVIPGTLFAQGIARWGNFFNQELYGPPTDAPWGIAIDCAHRAGTPWLCPPAGAFPFETTGFHPMFFYESALDILGGLIALYVSRRMLWRLQPGDLTAFWGIWYGLIRAGLETLRSGYNWTLGGGLPTATVIGLGLALFGAAWIIYNHRPGSFPYAYMGTYAPAPPPADPFAGEDDFDEDDDSDDEPNRPPE